MTTPVDLNRVDGALARGDVVAPEVWTWMDRVIGPKRAILDTPLSSIQTVASNDAEKQAAIADVAITADSDSGLSAVDDSAADVVSDEPQMSVAPDVTYILPQEVAEPLSADMNRGGRRDDMAWLSGRVSEESVSAFNSFVTAAATDRVAELSAQHSPRQPSAEDRQRSIAVHKLLSTYSMQRRAVWQWCEDHDEMITDSKPSARDVGAASGVSYETARLVLKDYRNLRPSHVADTA